MFVWSILSRDDKGGSWNILSKILSEGLQLFYTGGYYFFSTLGEAWATMAFLPWMFLQERWLWNNVRTKCKGVGSRIYDIKIPLTSNAEIKSCSPSVIAIWKSDHPSPSANIPWYTLYMVTYPDIHCTWYWISCHRLLMLLLLLFCCFCCP